MNKEYNMILNPSVVSKGCDISYWQGKIDFKKMYSAGIRFVIIRAGYGTTVDKNFITYINGALAAGLQVGVYWFIYAVGEATSRDNAHKFLETIKPYMSSITHGVWADWEYDSDRNAGYMTSAKRSLIVRTFLSQLAVAGLEVGIYSNQDYIQSGKFTASLIKEYPLWFAKYSETIGKYAERGKDGHPYFYQYTSSGNGKLYGAASSGLDLDWGYITLEEIKQQECILDKVQSDPKVIKASDNPYPTPKRDIKYVKGQYMQHGDDIKWGQWNLWRFGVLLDKNGVPDATQIDGYWGPKCDIAQKTVEKKLNIKIDGILGKTERELYIKI